MVQLCFQFSLHDIGALGRAKADSLRINFDSQHTTFSKSNADWFLCSSMPVAGFRPFLSQGDLARRRQIAQP